MIYFLVNNSYHAVDAVAHIAEIDPANVVLIEIPHSLEAVDKGGVAGRHRYVRARRPGLLFQVLNYLGNIRCIRRDIAPGPQDVLFLYTEFEILNQYVVALFRRAGARVYLLEDGGLGTYVPFRLPGGEALNFREAVRFAVYRCLPGLQGIRSHKVNGHVFYWGPDASIDGLCLYRPVTVRRNIATILLRFPIGGRIAPVAGRTVFLNEPLYDVYLGLEEYLAALSKLLEALCAVFSEVIFKFHPRETGERRALIRRRVLAGLPAVKEIENDSAIETTVGNYRPAVLSSFFCSALLTLAMRGIEPLYLYHLVPALREQPVAREVTSVLCDLGYGFVGNLTEIGPAFKSGLVLPVSASSAISLGQIAAGG